MVSRHKEEKSVNQRATEPWPTKISCVKRKTKGTVLENNKSVGAIFYDSLH